MLSSPYMCIRLSALARRRPYSKSHQHTDNTAAGLWDVCSEGIQRGLAPKKPRAAGRKAAERAREALSAPVYDEGPEIAAGTQCEGMPFRVNYCSNAHRSTEIEWTLQVNWAAIEGRAYVATYFVRRLFSRATNCRIVRRGVLSLFRPTHFSALSQQM